MFGLNQSKTCMFGNILLIFLLYLDYTANATVYSTAKSKINSSRIGRIGEPLTGEKYISSLWKSAKDRITSSTDARTGTINLSPQGSPLGPTLLKIVPKGDSFGKKQLAILSTGTDIDPLDLSTLAGKIIQLPDTGKGPVQILKSPGPSTSVLVRRGQKPTAAKTVSQIKAALGKKGGSESNYIGSVTSILAETLCPLCGRLRNPRYRMSCMLRYCYENPSLSSGNPP